MEYATRSEVLSRIEKYWDRVQIMKSEDWFEYRVSVDEEIQNDYCTPTVEAPREIIFRGKKRDMLDDLIPDIVSPKVKIVLKDTETAVKKKWLFS